MSRQAKSHRHGTVPSDRRPVFRARALRWHAGEVRLRPERLATEEPLEIRVGGPGVEPEALTVTMRTPGADFDLAAGFLFAEGIVTSAADVADIRYCDLPAGEQQLYNVVSVVLRQPFDVSSLGRNFAVNSSCGVCGKATLDQLALRCGPVPPGAPVSASVLVALPDTLRGAQRVFDQTGGLHAAGLFDASGGLVAVREDVGRHNALDKLVGRSLLAQELPLTGSVVALSGRVSFELVQKAAMAGVGVICAVSAPSSLAVQTAEAFGITVVGFVRDGSFNAYSHPERIGFEA